MFRIVLFVCLLANLGFAQSPVSPAEKELQQPILMDDVKPTQGKSVDHPPSGWRALGSTVVVVLLMGGGLWAFRRYGVKRLPGTGGTRLAIEETLAVGERRFVSILKADDARFLIALGPQGVTLLARLTAAELGDHGTFEQVLQQQTESNAPVPVRVMEAMLKGTQP